jgi:hypothetical protein
MLRPAALGTPAALQSSHAGAFHAAIKNFSEADNEAARRIEPSTPREAFNDEVLR